MINQIFTFSISIVGLVLGSIVDLRTREVPDYLTFSFMIIGFCFSLLASIVYSDIQFIISSLLGFLFCFVLASIMFYTGQWGGGDAKLLMGLGALLGLPFHSIYLLKSFSLAMFHEIPFLVVFIPLILIIGGFYCFIWMLVLLFRYWTALWQHYKKALQQHKNIRIRFVFYCIAGFSIIIGLLMQDFYFRLTAFFMAIIILLLYYAVLFTKSIEYIALVKKVIVSKVTVGDWIAHNVIVDGTTIVSTKGLGVTEKQLILLKRAEKEKKLTYVFVRHGIPFVPSFLLAFIATFILLYLL